MPSGSPEPIRHSWPLWGLSFGYFTISGIFNSASEVIDVVTGDTTASVWEPIVWEMSSQYAFAILTPFLVTFTLHPAVRFALRTWPSALLSHLAAMVAFSVGHVAAMVGMRKAVYLLVGRTYEFGNLRLELPYEFFKDVGTFWVIVGLVYGFD